MSGCVRRAYYELYWSSRWARLLLSDGHGPCKALIASGIAPEYSRSVHQPWPAQAAMVGAEAAITVTIPGVPSATTACPGVNGRKPHFKTTTCSRAPSTLALTHAI